MALLLIDIMRWTEIKVKRHVPSPRAGMSLCNVESKLYLFGGSGPSASCFNDLQIYDPGEFGLVKSVD